VLQADSISFDKIVPDFSRSRPSPALSACFGRRKLDESGQGSDQIVIVGVAIWTQLWPERGTLDSILSQSTASVAGRHVASSVQSADAALASLAVIAGWIISGSACAGSPATVCPAGDQGRVSPE